MPVRILIADDHGVLRAGLRALLNAEPDLQVVGEAGDGWEALRLAAELQPDLMLMDISMPGLDGLEATRLLRRRHPRLRILLLTLHEEEDLVREAIEAGASGYIVKRAAESELLGAVRAVAAGHMYVHPSMTRAFVGQHGRPPRDEEGSSEVTSLTPRETEVLELVAAGYTNRQVADRLGIGQRTVETHRANLMAKLNLRSRAALVRYAVDHGLLGAGSQGS
jgi:two-component system response regulator NreC